MIKDFKMPQSPKSSTPFEEYLSSYSTLTPTIDDPDEILMDDFERQWNLTENPLFVWGDYGFAKPII